MFKLENLTIRYGQKIAAHQVTFSIAPGEILALIGPNGAGKTSLIRAASGVVEISSGQISYRDKNITQLSETQRAQLISVVPQAHNLGGAFTVSHTVTLGRTPYLGWLGNPTKQDQDIVRDALERTSLTPLAQRRVAELSGGEQQRVLIARALAQDTPVMLLDEPTNHLDLKHQSQILNLIRSLAVENNIAVLMAMHDLNLVSFFADRVALLASSKLIKIGTPAEVLTQERIQEAYQTEVQLVHHPSSGNPLILPGNSSKHPQSPSYPPQGTDSKH